MDSPWDEDVTDDNRHRGVEWENMASNFTNAGYREGITAGKEGALQEGFDSGFEMTGAPIGRQVGRARGVTSALLSLFNENPSLVDQNILAEVREIASQLSSIRFSEIAPPDLEAEEHEREHRLANDGESMDVNEEIQAKNDVEGLEDLMSGMGTSSGSAAEKAKRLTMDDFSAILSRIHQLTAQLGLNTNMS